MAGRILGPRAVGGALVAALLAWSLVMLTGQPRWLAVDIARVGGYRADVLRIGLGLPPGADRAQVHATIDDRVRRAGYGTPRWSGDDVMIFGATRVDRDRLMPALRTPGKLELRWALDDDPAMAGLVELAPAYGGAGVRADTNRWRDDQTGADHQARFVRADNRAHLDAFLAWARAAHPEVALPPDRGFEVEELPTPPGTPAACDRPGDRPISSDRCEQSARRPIPPVRLWVLARAPLIDNADLVDAHVEASPYDNRPQVLVSLTRAAGRRFGEETDTHVGHHLAIVADGRVLSVPIVQTAIYGGRLAIAMGGTDPRLAERQAEDLVAALSPSPPLPAGITFDHEAFTPGRRAWLLYGSPVVIALVAGLLVLLIAVPLGRLAPLDAAFPIARVARRPWPPIGPLALRVAITAGLALAMLLAQGLALPGVNGDSFADFAGRHASLAPVSIVALGILPIISASVLVELAALLTARGRARRLGGPAARRGMARATIVLAAVLALVQGYFVARWLESVGLRWGELLIWSPGWSTRLLLMVTLAAGTMALAAIATLIGRWGVGNGYAVLILTGAIAGLWHAAATRHALGAENLAAGAAAVVAIAALTIWTVRTTFRGRHRLPLGGTIPLQAAAGVVAVLGVVAFLLGPWLLDVLDLLPPQLGLTTWLALVVGFGAAGALIAVRIEARRAGARATARARRGDLAVAVAVSAAYLAILILLGRLVRSTLALDGLVIAGAAAIAVDLAAELALRAREGGLVAIASFQAVVDADRACAALGEAGIPVACQGLAYRALLRIFGPFVPIDVLVPAGLAERAHAIVAGAPDPVAAPAPADGDAAAPVSTGSAS